MIFHIRHTISISITVISVNNAIETHVYSNERNLFALAFPFRHFPASLSRFFRKGGTRGSLAKFASRVRSPTRILRNRKFSATITAVAVPYYGGEVNINGFYGHSLRDIFRRYLPLSLTIGAYLARSLAKGCWVDSFVFFFFFFLVTWFIDQVVKFDV